MKTKLLCRRQINAAKHSTSTNQPSSELKIGLNFRQHQSAENKDGRNAPIVMPDGNEGASGSHESVRGVKNRDEPIYENGQGSSYDDVDIAISRPNTDKVNKSWSEERKPPLTPSFSAPSHHPTPESSESVEKVTLVDIMGNLLAIASYLFDVGSDLWVAYTYFMAGHWWWFGLTLSFVFVPSMIITLFSLSWYMEDHKAQQERGSPFRWVSRIVFFFFQIAPVLRYIDSIIYGVRSRKAVERVENHKDWYYRMLNEDTDSTLLRLFECFLEAAPQLVLQLYVISTIGLQSTWYMGAAQCVSCFTSLFSLSWGIASYHKALRFSTHTAKMNWSGFILQILWRSFTLASRVLALGLFASQVPGWIFAVAVGTHCLLMWIWVIMMRTDFCNSRAKEALFNLVLAGVYIFDYVNAIKGHTRLRYLIYYTTVCIENCAMAAIWYSLESAVSNWYIKFAMAMILLGLFIGICCQVIYYKCFHPVNYSPELTQIQTCLPWEQWVNGEDASSTMEGGIGTNTQGLNGSRLSVGNSLDKCPDVTACSHHDDTNTQASPECKERRHSGNVSDEIADQSLSPANSPSPTNYVTAGVHSHSYDKVDSTYV